jgi:hypothetical protein
MNPDTDFPNLKATLAGNGSHVEWPAMREEVRRVFALLSEITRERDQACERVAAAEVIADAYACDLLRNESGEGWGDGWREIGEDPEGLLPQLVYAASRGLIERGTDPAHPYTFRFTKAGKEWL